MFHKDRPGCYSVIRVRTEARRLVGRSSWPPVTTTAVTWCKPLAVGITRSGQMGEADRRQRCCDLQGLGWRHCRTQGYLGLVDTTPSFEFRGKGHMRWQKEHQWPLGRVAEFRFWAPIY